MYVKCWPISLNVIQNFWKILLNIQKVPAYLPKCKTKVLQISPNVHKVLAYLIKSKLRSGRSYQMYIKCWHISPNVNQKLWQLLPNVHKVLADLTKCKQRSRRYHRMLTGGGTGLVAYWHLVHCTVLLLCRPNAGLSHLFAFQTV